MHSDKERQSNSFVFNKITNCIPFTLFPMLVGGSNNPSKREEKRDQHGYVNAGIPVKKKVIFI